MAKMATRDMIDIVYNDTDELEVTLGDKGEVWINLNGICVLRAQAEPKTKKQVTFSDGRGGLRK